MIISGKRGAEVKKGIEWLKREIPNLRGYAVIIDGEDGELEPVTTVSMEDIYELINQLDKLEVLSQEWIDEHRESTFDLDEDFETVFIKVEDLQNLLVPKQGLPTIPEFVAEFLEGKEDYMLYELFDDEWLYEEHDQIAKWLYDNDEETNRERELSLALAHIYGYEVETEQRYYVINNDQRMMLVRMMDGKTITEADPFKLEDMYEAEKKAHRLTEKEIKDYDERYFSFAVKVEEMEAH